MAPAVSLLDQTATHETPSHTPPKRTPVQAMVESDGLTSIPSTYYSATNPDETAASDPDDTIPTIDFSLLTSSDPDQRSKAIKDMDKACQEWGFFMLVNHGVSESLMKAVLDSCKDFFNLPMEEKMQFAGKDLWEPIRFGSGVDAKDEKLFWRDFLKVIVHPEFHFPNTPKGFSEVAQDFCKRSREVTMELLKGMSKALGLEECYIEKAMNLDSGLQLFVANLYPLCPQPELAMGIPAHTDRALLTLLIENGIGGLQIQHEGKWFHVNPLPNSFLVNTGDQLEILSNGRYKSIMHRAVVNNKAPRISIAAANGSSLDMEVSPAPEIVERQSGGRPAYKTMKYKDYLECQGRKPGLDNVKIAPVA